MREIVRCWWRVLDHSILRNRFVEVAFYPSLLFCLNFAVNCQKTFELHTNNKRTALEHLNERHYHAVNYTFSLPVSIDKNLPMKTTIRKGEQRPPTQKVLQAYKILMHIEEEGISNKQIRKFLNTYRYDHFKNVHINYYEYNGIELHQVLNNSYEREGLFKDLSDIHYVNYNLKQEIAKEIEDPHNHPNKRYQLYIYENSAAYHKVRSPIIMILPPLYFPDYKHFALGVPFLSTIKKDFDIDEYPVEIIHIEHELNDKSQSNFNNHQLRYKKKGIMKLLFSFCLEDNYTAVEEFLSKLF